MTSIHYYIPAVPVTEPDISLALLTVWSFQHFSLSSLPPVLSTEPLSPPDQHASSDVHNKKV